MPEARRNRRTGTAVAPRTARLHTAVGAGLALLFLAATALGVRHLLDPATLPIREVRIEGEFRHLASADLRRAVASEVTGGFFGVDVDGIRAALLGEPWVHDAAVRRAWPDGLDIVVEEQRPVAYWGATALLNEHGAAFSPPPASFPPGLPRLAGPRGAERRVLLRYREAAEAMGAVGLKVAELRLTERRAWRFRIEDGPEVMVGRADFHGRLARLARVLDRVYTGTAGPVERIDLRYTNGIAVRPGAATDAAVTDAGY